MGTCADANPRRGRRARSGRIIEPLGWTLAALAVSVSAIVTKELGAAPPLARVETSGRSALAPAVQPAPERVRDSGAPMEHEQVVVEPESVAGASDIRWFDGRPVRPARTISMVVTGYSPDARSCGKYADGKTATLHSVWTNAMQLVAADPKVLPYGSIVSVPGYAGDELVPVLDCGQAIKGHRLDLLFATHAQAMAWGRKRVSVTVWEYADGRGPTDPRKVR
ncbi:MAG: hypothetical protein Kow0022_06370 [Phycisphaerales bacterium]